jgi:hypothetical protein
MALSDAVKRWWARLLARLARRHGQRLVADTTTVVDADQLRAYVASVDRALTALQARVDELEVALDVERAFANRQAGHG